MHYVISDIHGYYDKYLELLQKINFCDDDTLFFLGDGIDRGPDGIRVLLDMMERKNVVPILGNHEDTFYFVIHALSQHLSAADKISVAAEQAAWVGYDGGSPTWEAYWKLPEETRQKLLDYVKNFELCMRVHIGGKVFLLSHAGLGTYREGIRPEDCCADDFLWGRMDYNKVYCPGVYLVSGHIPTCCIDADCAGKILQKNNHIAIDCGVSHLGTLGCICLETLEEFYV